jgi:hypothetical protein
MDIVRSQKQTFSQNIELLNYDNMHLFSTLHDYPTFCQHFNFLGIFINSCKQVNLTTVRVGVNILKFSM